MSAAYAPGKISAWPEARPHFTTRRSRDANNATRVYLVCSARPRVGKTLLARLITEHCRADEHPELGYFVDPIDVSLNDFLPGSAQQISLLQTKGQMALFDRLVIDDAITKIVDIGHTAPDRFFTIAYDIDLGREARTNGVDIIVAYVADPSALSQQVYAALRARFPEFTFIPVFNDAVARGLDFHSLFPASSGGVHAMTLPQMPAAVQAIADRPPFSSNDFLRRPPAIAPYSLIEETDAFRKKVFRQLRETELALLLNRLRLTLAEPAA